MLKQQSVFLGLLNALTHITYEILSVTIFASHYKL